MANNGLIVAGSRITAALINSIAPLAAVKQTDQTVTSSTTLVNDTALVLPVVAGAQYIFECHLDFEGNTQGSGDLKWGWTLPASATLRYVAPRVDDSGTAHVAGEFTGSQTVIAGTNGSTNLTGVLMKGTLFVSSTAGNIQLQWAQAHSNATGTIVHAQSHMALWRTT